MKANMQSQIEDLKSLKRQKKKQRGFTLIELMIVVAIIGILAAIAIPQYQAYTGRAQAAEAVTLFSGVKTSLGEYYNDRGCWPGDATKASCTISGTANTDVGAAAPNLIAGTYVGSVTIAADGTGYTTVAFDGGVHSGSSMLFRPTATAGTIEWLCWSTTIESNFLPSSCRNAAPSTGTTTGTTDGTTTGN